MGCDASDTRRCGKIAINYFLIEHSEKFLSSLFNDPSCIERAQEQMGLTEARDDTRSSRLRCSSSGNHTL